MGFQLPTYKEEVKQYTKDLSQKKSRFVSKPVRKQLTYIRRDPFTLVDGPPFTTYSYIVGKFNYYLENNISFLLPLSQESTFQYCPCVSWKPTSETIVRYKLWQAFGELLYAPIYNGEVINKNFSIEIWNTPLGSVGVAGKIYTSKMNLPTSNCDFESEVDISGTIKQCPDITYVGFIGSFNPQTEKYVVIDDCGTTNKIPI